MSSLFCVLWRKLHLSLLPLSLILYMVSELGSGWGAQAASRGKRRSWNPGKRISISFLVSFWEHTGAGTQSWMQSAKPQIEAPFVVEHESITWKNFHSETVSASVLASRSFSRHSGRVAVLDCVCPFFAVERSCNRKVAVCPIAENLRNAGQFWVAVFMHFRHLVWLVVACHRPCKAEFLVLQNCCYLPLWGRTQFLSLAITVLTWQNV